MKIYTKTGDDGTTSLYNGRRVKKSSIFFQVLGTIDELSSNIGLLCSFIQPVKTSISLFDWIKNYFSPCTHDYKYKDLRRIQMMLQRIGGIIAMQNDSCNNYEFEDETRMIEQLIDSMEHLNPKLTKFILSGVNSADAQSHVCRSVTRRVERLMWLAREGEEMQIDLAVLKYINRISDFFFVYGRWLCSMENIPDCFF